jgi:predicted kinase
MGKDCKLRLYVGIPASGKSTAAKEFIKKNSGWVSVNRDSYRLMLRNEQICEPKVEDLITTLVNITIHNALAKNLNVIIDATNVKEKYIRQFINEFKYSADIDYQVFDISLDKAIERDNNREAKVGASVIKRMYNDYKILMDSFDFQPVSKMRRPDLMLPDINIENQCIIVDVDNTLALMSNRSPFDYKKVMNDRMNWIIREQIEFHKSKNRTIFICSGREDICREETIMWLEYYNIYFDHLLIRKKDDYRKDFIVKRELYETEIKNKFNVISVYDDRQSVISEWLRQGFYVYDVSQGNKFI